MTQVMYKNNIWLKSWEKVPLIDCLKSNCICLLQSKNNIEKGTYKDGNVFQYHQEHLKFD